MSIGRLFGRQPRTMRGHEKAIERWRALPAAPLRIPLRDARLVAVDVEVSGLDARHDRVTGVGAVVLHDGRIDMTDLFHLPVLQPGEEPNPGKGEHRSPMDRAAALLGFVGRSVLVTYNAPFVRLMLNRFLREAGAPPLDQPWIDLAWMLPDLMGREFSERTTFEEWQRLLGIYSSARHHGLADAFAIAQITLVALARAEDAGYQSVEGLMSAETYRRRIRGE